MDLIVPGNGILLWQLAGLSYLGFWVYALYDMIRSDFKESQMKSSMTKNVTHWDDYSPCEIPSDF